eukprot:CAMPEP_0177619418 /NCGR_PEP_ID=MMETSP0419_2-20121207/26246_1 /TAXON_ID=582737 /ORGANISM="Tetraselmis sp., Strain GSL018" /LENGTH=98 /DNA_ID=CAMNT_0019118677 /DNA_START=381 /DNA_END=674 /DNA_ORIENTATION=+
MLLAIVLTLTPVWQRMGVGEQESRKISRRMQDEGSKETSQSLYMDNVEDKWDLREKKRQHALIQSAISKIDKPVLNKATNMMRASNYPEQLRLHLDFQ